MGPALIGRVEAHGQRLDQRPLQCAHVVRQLEAQVGLVGHILLEHAVHRRGGEEDHVRAEVILPLPAEFAAAAGLARLQGHPVPDLQVFDGAAHLYHSAPRLVAQDKRRLDHIIADGPRLIVVHIAAADAHILQLDQHLVLLWGGNGAGGIAHFAHAVHHRDLHAPFHKKTSLSIKIMTFRKVLFI